MLCSRMIKVVPHRAVSTPFDHPIPKVHQQGMSLKLLRRRTRSHCQLIFATVLGIAMFSVALAYVTLNSSGA